MNKIIVAGLALTAAAASLVTTPAAQAGEPVPGPEGLFCDFAVLTDPNPDAPPSVITGVIYVGPATVPASPDPLAGGTMTCKIKVGGGFHNSPTRASTSFNEIAVGVIIGAELVSYTDPGDPRYVCTSYTTTDGVTLYFTSDDNGGRWHTDPTKACSEATSTGTQYVWDIVDGEVCPVFQGFAQGGNPPPGARTWFDVEGDTFIDFEANDINEATAMDDLFYDCPVYTFTIDDDTANPDRAAGGVIDL